MKRILLCITVLLLQLTGCGGQQEPEASQPPETTLHQTTQAPALVDFAYSDVAGFRFLFASGAGGWGTVLYIQPDGSFSGNFRDSEAQTGPGYPNGAVTYCDFSGKFGAPVPISPYSCSLEIQSLEYQYQPGTEAIKDGILYRYAAAYGLSGAESMVLYLPGTPAAELPEDLVQWFGYDLNGQEQLPFYALYNQENWYCFSGRDVAQEIRQQVTETEALDAEIQTQLQTAITQSDMNTAACNRYLIWDGVLNELWQVLKALLPEEEMRQLTNEELAWIKEKEQAVAEAGAEVEGGSLYPAVTNGLAAAMTRERVYELLEYLPDGV